MSSSPTSSKPDPSQNLNHATSEEINPSNQVAESQSESHQRSLTATEPPRAYKLGAEFDSRTELQGYDERARIWIIVYVCWLAWNIYTCCPYFLEDVFEPLLELRFGLVIANFIGPLFSGAPFLFQLWGIFKRNVKATNRGINILCFYGVFATISFVVGCFMFVYTKEVYELSSLGRELMREKMPYHPHIAYVNDFPSRERFKEMTWEMFQQTGKSFAYFVVGYIAARKIRDYLNGREKFIKQKTD